MGFWDDVLSVTKDVGTSATRIVTDTGLDAASLSVDLANLATQGNFQNEMTSAQSGLDTARSEMSKAGVLTAAEAIEKNHFPLLKARQAEAKAKHAMVSAIYPAAKMLEAQLTDRSATLRGMASDIAGMQTLADQIHQSLSRVAAKAKSNMWVRIFDIDLSPLTTLSTASPKWDAIGQKIMIAEGVVAAGSGTGALAGVGMMAAAGRLKSGASTLGKVGKASKLLKIGKLVGRASAVLSIALIGLDIGMSVVELKKREDQLSKELDELNTGIADANIALSEMTRQLMDINMRILEIVDSVGTNEAGWDGWVDAQTDALRETATRAFSAEGLHQTALALARSSVGTPQNIRIMMVRSASPAISDADARDIIAYADKNIA